MEVTLTLPEAQQDAAVALLESLGYDSFWQDSDTLRAYITGELWDAEPLRDLLPMLGATDWQAAPLAAQNWNTAWEAQYDPVSLPGWVQIVAQHHVPEPDYPHTLHIQPRMAFGTGHHATTRLMLAAIRDFAQPGQRVLDMGCGTGVLGILSARLGAGHVDFVDNDPICITNTADNLTANTDPQDRNLAEVTPHGLHLGSADAIPPNARYDLILANINRNVLLEIGDTLAHHLNPGGVLLLSGFLDVDSERINHYFRTLKVRSTPTTDAEPHDATAAATLQLAPAHQGQEANWMCLGFRLGSAHAHPHA
jgi:ribosomal protein L11 methyltransferase